MATDRSRRLGEWTAPSGAHVVVTARVRIELDVFPMLSRDDRRWFLEEVLPQLRGPLQTWLDGDLTRDLAWSGPADDEVPG